MEKNRPIEGDGTSTTTRRLKTHPNVVVDDVEQQKESAIESVKGKDIAGGIEVVTSKEMDLKLQKKSTPSPNDDKATIKEKDEISNADDPSTEHPSTRTTVTTTTGAEEATEQQIIPGALAVYPDGHSRNSSNDVDDVDNLMEGSNSHDDAAEPLQEVRNTASQNEVGGIHASVEALDAHVVNEQKELEDAIQHRMRQISVDASNVTTSKNDDDDDDETSGSRTRRLAWVIGLVIVVLAAAVSLAVLLPKDRRNEDDSYDTNDNDDGTDTAMSALLEELRTILIEKEITTGNSPNLNGGSNITDINSLFVEGSPQYQALEWLVHEDSSGLVLDWVMMNGNDSEKDVILDMIVERFIMTTLFLSTGGLTDKWSLSTGYMTNSSVCDWFGVVRCDDNTGRILEIGLDAVGLNGTLPVELSMLSALESLHLNSNNLFGTIPHALFRRLLRLQYIDLSVNLLTGVSLMRAVLPSNGYHMLGSSDTSHYALMFLVASLLFLSQSIPDTVEYLTRLDFLYLHSNQLEGTIPSLLTQIETLNTLAIDQNLLSGTIPEFSADSNIEVFLAKSNVLTGVSIFSPNFELTKCRRKCSHQVALSRRLLLDYSGVPVFVTSTTKFHSRNKSINWNSVYSYRRTDQGYQF